MKKLFFALTFLFVFGSLSETIRANTHVNPETPSISEAAIGGAYLTFAGKFGGEISKKDLETHNEVQVVGCAIGSKVFQFTLYITKKGRKTSYQTRSSNLTTEMLRQLRSLSAGDEFEFRKIKAHLPKNEGVVDVTAKKFWVV